MTETAWCHTHCHLRPIVKLLKSSRLMKGSTAIWAHVALACGHTTNIVTSQEREARMRWATRDSR